MTGSPALPARLRRALRVTGGLLVLLVGACGGPGDPAVRHLSAARQAYAAGDFAAASLEVRNALQINPGQAEARYLKALLEERAGNVPAVVDNLERAVAADPRYLAAWLKLGNYHVALGRVPAARTAADAALALAADNASAHLLDARTRYLEGRRDEAWEAAVLARRLAPDRQDVVVLQATLLAGAGRYAEAGRLVEAAVAEATRTGGRAAGEGLRRVQVAVFLRAGDTPAAERALRALAADFPGTATYELSLVRLQARAGRLPEAEAGLRALIARDPDNAGWRVQLASLLAGADQPEAAESALRDAVAANPGSGTLRLALGGFYERTGRPAESAGIYRALAAADPRSGDGLAARNRLVALALGTDPAGAGRLIATILADAPGNVDALLYRAALHVRERRLDEAAADLSSALARQPDSRRALLMLARVRLLAGEADLAAAAYRRLLAVDPAQRLARQELASLEGSRGNAAAAADLLRESLRLDPRDTDASAGLVAALLAGRDFAAAEGEARRVLELGDGSGRADYQLGLALEAQGDGAGAQAAYRRALARNPLADEPLEALVALLVRDGRQPDAEAALRAHVAANPGHATAWLLLAGFQRAGNRPAEARASLGTVLAAQPANVAAHLGLAALEPAGSAARRRVLEAAHARVPGSADIGLALGAALEQQGEFDAAIAVYEAVLAAGGRSEFLVDNLAVLLLDHRSDAASRARALDLMRPYLRGSTASPVTLGILGWAFHRNGDDGTARRYLERAVQGGQVGNPQLHYYLGMVRLRAGDPAAARQSLATAVRTADERRLVFKGLAEARAELARLDAPR